MDYDQRNQCCCGKIHIMNGCKYVGIFEAICLVFTFFTIIGLAYVGFWGNFVVSLLAWGLWVFVVFMLFRGLSKRTARHLAPHLLLQIICIIFSAICIVLLIFAVIFNSKTLLNFFPIPQAEQENSDGFPTELIMNESIREAAATALAAYLIQILLQVWIWSVVYKCYQFLKRENEFGPLVDPPGVAAKNDQAVGGPHLHDMYDKEKQQF